MGLFESRGGPSRPVARPSRTPTVPEVVPLYSDVWFDDSGIFLATAFEVPVTDPTSLEQVGLARQGRGARGIATVSEELARLGTPKTVDDARKAARYELYIGGLHLFDGRFEEASAALRGRQGRSSEPSRPVRHQRRGPARRLGHATGRVRELHRLPDRRELHLSPGGLRRPPPDFRAPGRRFATSPPTWRSGRRTLASDGS